MNFKLSDSHSTANMYPICQTTRLSDVLIGAFTIHNRWEKLLKAPLSNTAYTHTIMVDILPDIELVNTITRLKQGQSLYNNDTPIVIAKDESEKIQFKNSIRKLNYVWDLVKYNQEILVEDISSLDGYTTLEPNEQYKIIGDNKVYIGKNVKIYPYTIFNTENGSIVLSDNTTVEEMVVVRGPFFADINCTLKAQSSFSGGCTFGEFTKIGGEINNVVIQGFTNKSHDGYLGNSILGKWCNLGADTTSSNLRNDYGMVKAYSYVEEKMIDTNMQFFGCAVGDHSKFSIGTSLNTGTIIGVSCNLYGSEFHKQFIPSFTWGHAKKYLPFRFDKAITVAKSMMNRRMVEMSKEELEKLQQIQKEESIFSK